MSEVLEEKFTQEGGSHFISDRSLAGFRVAVVLLTIYFFAWQVAVQDPVINYWHFLTNWGFTLLTIYGFSCFFLSFGRPSHYYNEVHRAVFAAAIPIAMIVSVGFWTLLSDQVFNPSKYSHYTENVVVREFELIYAHLANLIMAIVSLFLGKTVIGWIHVVYPIFIVLAYTASVMISFCVFEASWPYGFLNILGSSPSTLKPLNLVLFLVAIIIIVVFFFWLTLLLVAIRDRGKNVGIRDEIQDDNESIGSVELSRIRVKHQDIEDTPEE